MWEQAPAQRHQTQAQALLDQAHDYANQCPGHPSHMLKGSKLLSHKAQHSLLNPH